MPSPRFGAFAAGSVFVRMMVRSRRACGTKAVRASGTTWVRTRAAQRPRPQPSGSRPGPQRLRGRSPHPPTGSSARASPPALRTSRPTQPIFPVIRFHHSRVRAVWLRGDPRRATAGTRRRRHRVEDRGP
jgi:hypothetical protein